MSIMYLKASIDVNILTFLRNMGGGDEAVDHEVDLQEL